MAGGARVIRQLREPDAESYVELRRQGLLEAPLAFGASPEDDMPPRRRRYVTGFARGRNG